MWYDNHVVGINTLDGNMKHRSNAFKPGQTRATSITILGFEACHIMSVSGHRQESSICSYASSFYEVCYVKSNCKYYTGTEITTDSPKQPLRVINGNSSKPSQFNPLNVMCIIYAPHPLPQIAMRIYLCFVFSRVITSTLFVV